MSLFGIVERVFLASPFFWEEVLSLMTIGLDERSLAQAFIEILNRVS